MPCGHATPSSGDLTLLPGQRLSQQTPPNEPPLSPTPQVTSACRDNTALCKESPPLKSDRSRFLRLAGCGGQVPAAHTGETDTGPT